MRITIAAMPTPAWSPSAPFSERGGSRPFLWILLEVSISSSFSRTAFSHVLGLLVSIVILRQGVGFLVGSWADLTDASVSSKTRQSLQRTLDRVVDPSATAPVLAIRNLRARHAGSLIYVDLVADVPSTLTVTETASVEDKICHTLMTARKEVAEVRVKFHPVNA